MKNVVSRIYQIETNKIRYFIRFFPESELESETGPVQIFFIPWKQAQLIFFQSQSR